MTDAFIPFMAAVSVSGKEKCVKARAHTKRAVQIDEKSSLFDPRF